MNTYDFDMPGISKKIEMLQIENAQLVGRIADLQNNNTGLRHQLRNLQQANVLMAELIYGDGEIDTSGYTVAALVSALQQYANRDNWTRDAEIEYRIDNYVEAGSIRLGTPIVWKCGTAGYLLAERALNGDIE